MSVPDCLPAYCEALADFARTRLGGPSGDWSARVQGLCPEFHTKIPAQEIHSHPAEVQSLFCALLGLIQQELNSLAQASGYAYEANEQAGGFGYKVGQHALFASRRTMFELWRFGVGLLDPAVDAVALSKEMQAHALAWLVKEVQGAWRVAQRRSKAFGRAKQVLHPAGQERQAQARAVESALAIVLSDEAIGTTRADLATDWLQGVDLWWHRPGQAPHKGSPVALSLTTSKPIEERKAQTGPPLWTPSRLAERMREDLLATQRKERMAVAQAAWEGLESPPDLPAIANQLLQAWTQLTKAKRGVHPAALLDARVGRWLRSLRKV